MSAVLAPSAKPSWAVTCWIDDNNIYVEIPTSAALGHPYIEKWPVCEGGLSKALNFLRKRYELVPTEEKNYTKAPEVKYRGQKKVVQSDEQRANTLNVLRKLGLV